MASNGGNSSGDIIGEIERLKAEKNEIENRITLLQSQLDDNAAMERDRPSPPTTNGSTNGLTPEAIYRYSRQLLLPSFGVEEFELKQALDIDDAFMIIGQ
ncbi:Adenylyltransferase and sulfurtransferase MOCS3 [Asimina triloba]